MNEKERKKFVKDCLREYHQEDMQILIHESVMQITCISYFLYNQIFFGNKILFFRETLEKIQEMSKEEAKTKYDGIRIRNSGYFLQALENDHNGNYKIIEQEKVNSETENVLIFLKQNSNAIYYLEDYSLYMQLKENNLNNKQLVLLEKGVIEVNPFRHKQFRFETMGPIKIEDGRMMIYQKEDNDTLLKVYNARGKEKTEKVIEVKTRDFVLIRGKKEDSYSFNLYEIVSTHTRNNAIRIIWTVLKIGQKSNKYIDRLPYQYRKMILDNNN